MLRRGVQTVRQNLAQEASQEAGGKRNIDVVEKGIILSCLCILYLVAI